MLVWAIAAAYSEMPASQPGAAIPCGFAYTLLLPAHSGITITMWAVLLPMMPFVEAVDAAVDGSGRMPYPHLAADGLPACPASAVSRVPPRRPRL